MLMMNLENLTPKDIENVFWEMMERGWVSGKIEKQEAPLLPGYKCIPFKIGRFSVLDAYSAPVSDGKSVGFMTIWFDETPIWTMNYGGQYPREVIPFLKAALKSSIIRRDFVGGRGPSNFEHDEYPDFVYINEVSDGNCSFLSFSGIEYIHDKISLTIPLGWHEYWGMSLI